MGGGNASPGYQVRAQKTFNAQRSFTSSTLKQISLVFLGIYS